MLTRSILKKQMMGGVVGFQSTLRPRGGKSKRPMMFVLTLTSLIDAFSILVIYLLVNFGDAASQIQVTKAMQLPSATNTKNITNGVVTVQIEDGRYFIENVEVSMSGLTKALYDIKNTKNIDAVVITADKKTDYAVLSPIMSAGSQAGISNFKFAVMQGGEKL